MTDSNTTLRRLFWRFFILLVLVGGTIYVNRPFQVKANPPTDCPWQFDNCKASCETPPPAQPGTYNSVCVAYCVNDRENCVASGGPSSEGGCENLFSACGLVPDDEASGACYGDYAQCLYATNVIKHSGWMGQEYDTNCVDEALAIEDDCFNGGNPDCINQTTNTVFNYCCMIRYKKDHEACLLY
jgi:hypothetical protein